MKYYRHNKFLQHCPIILLAQNENLGLQLVSDGKINGFLVKPCSDEKLVAAINHALESGEIGCA